MNREELAPILAILELSRATQALIERYKSEATRDTLRTVDVEENSRSSFRPLG
jgi:hypothetical protein